MSEHLENENGQSFAELFESYNTGMKDDLQVGDKIKGEIISIGRDSVFINTGTKIDGAVDKGELLDENGDLPHQTGDMLELWVVAMNENEIRLSKALSGVGGLNLLTEAYEGKLPVEGKVKALCKGGFEVEIMKRRAFCPVSQMDVKYVENTEEYVGSTHRFRISRLEENGRNIVVSRRQILEEEQQQARAEFMENVNIGDIVDGKVSHLASFGAFVELFPGVEGMVHISELSWSRVEKTEDAIQPDEAVRVKILGIEPGKKAGELKISLSMKQVEGNPWDRADQLFSAGDKVQGKVTRLAPFGAFVEIGPGLEGLVHISEMSYAKRVNRPEDVVNQGESVDVMVKEIDMERKRISLSIKDAEGDPWIGVADRYAVGQQVQGILEKKEKFGFFISLEPGVTGLMPKSKISESDKKDEISNLKAGDSLPVIISEIHTDARKISLIPEGGKVSEREPSPNEWRKFAGNQNSSLGSLGEQLQKAMNQKK